MQITMEAMFYSVTGRYGSFFIVIPEWCESLSWDCRITPQLNSTMPVLPTIQSDQVRQENMANYGILQANASKECDSSTQELQNSRFLWQFICTAPKPG